MEFPGRFDPDVARMLSLDAVEEVDFRVGYGARVFELSNDGDDVARVAKTLNELANEFAECRSDEQTARRCKQKATFGIPGLILENLGNTGRAIKDRSLEGKNVNEVVGLRKQIVSLLRSAWGERKRFANARCR